VELEEDARLFYEKLKEEGLLWKETQNTVIRFAPPLVILQKELE
jgi:ornithine--oxo-acid transaminase